MVFKNPIIFLMKNYKLLHFILTIITIFLIIHSMALLNLFSDYLSNGWFRNDINLINKYLPISYYILMTLIILVFLILILIFRKGKLSIKFYMFSILAILYIIITSFVHKDILLVITDKVVETSLIKLNRDLILISLTFEGLIILYSIFKIFGFDVKKIEFNEKENLKFTGDKELEFRVTFDKNSLMENFNSRKFNFISWLRENKKSIIVVITIIFIGMTFFTINILTSKKNKIDTLYYSNMSIKVNKSYTTKYDKNGNLLTEPGYYYLIVDVNMNTYSTNKNFKYKELELVFNKDIYTPIYDSKMGDIGKVYNGEILKSGIDNNFIVVYKVNNDRNAAKFRISSSKDVVDLNPINLDIEKEEYEFLSEMENVFVDNIYKGQTLKIYSFDFVEYHMIKERVCVGSYCDNMLIKRYADVLNSYKFFQLGIEYDMVIDIVSLLNTNAYLRSYEHVGGEYNYYDLIFDFSLIEKNRGKLYFNVKKNIEEKKHIDLVLNTREKIYVWKLK